MNYDTLSHIDIGTNIIVYWPASGAKTTCEYRGRDGNVAYVWSGTLLLAIAPEMIIGLAE